MLRGEKILTAVTIAAIMLLCYVLIRGIFWNLTDPLYIPLIVIFGILSGWAIWFVSSALSEKERSIEEIIADNQKILDSLNEDLRKKGV